METAAVAAIASDSSPSGKKKSTTAGAAKEAASGGKMKTTKTSEPAGDPTAVDVKTSRKSSKAKGATAVEPKADAAAEKPSKKKSAARTPKASAVGNGNGKGYSVAEVASKAQVDAQGYVFINGRRVRMISTKGVPPKKTAKSNSRGENDNDAPVRPKNIKTHLTKKQLNHYRELLLAKRHEIIGDLGAIEQEALRNVDGATHMPIHMADVGTDTYDQDFMLGLAEAERKQLLEIDDALMRIQQNTYGVCMMTGEPIPDARLEARPWAKYTIEAARQVEGGFSA
jgi:RNA polymerase-binding protein DksA